MLKRVKGMCEDGQAAGNAGLLARAELASDPGSSGSSGGEWEIISGKSDSQHEALARHSVEARFQRIAGPADIDSQEEEDYIHWAGTEQGLLQLAVQQAVALEVYGLLRETLHEAKQSSPWSERSAYLRFLRAFLPSE